MRSPEQSARNYVLACVRDCPWVPRTLIRMWAIYAGQSAYIARRRQKAELLLGEHKTAES